MGTGRDTAADRLQVMLHGVGIGARKHERGAGVARGADRAEHIGVTSTGAPAATPLPAIASATRSGKFF